jgi:hypothetical protein
MKVDMSPQAVTRRIYRVGELVKACRALRRKPAVPGEFKPKIAERQPNHPEKSGQVLE